MALTAGMLAAAIVSLNGLWDFRLEAGKTLEEVKLPAFAANDKMVVPGAWDAMSHYYNQRGTGCYRRSFELETDVVNAFLVVDGCCLRSKYWIDGREVGFSKLPWSKFEFATGPLKAGRHEIVAAVDSVVDNTKVKLFFDFYDFYAFGGFHHGVWLETQAEPVELRKVVVRTRDYRTGTVELEALYAQEGPADFTAAVAFDGGKSADVAFKNRRATLKVPNFRLWTPEAPNLHEVEVRVSASLTSGKDSASPLGSGKDSASPLGSGKDSASPLGSGKDSASPLKARFGIRTVGTAKKRITLNGKPIYLKGVNRHEAHYEFGATTPVQLMYEDIQNLKDLGGNFIRGAHYAQSDDFLTLCDELGVLVWEESLGWGNQAEQFNDPEFRELQKEETRLMVRNSINHPCIIVSAFMNEPVSSLPECKSLVDELIAVIRAEDTGHLVTFACNHTDIDISHANTDFIAYNAYPGWYHYFLKTGSHEELRARIRQCHEETPREFRERYKDDRPIIVSETGVKADYGVRDPRGRAQYTEDFQAEYTRLTLEEVFAQPEIAGIAIWQFTDAKTYTRVCGITGRSYGVNTGGLYDLYRRPKLSVEAVRELFHSSKVK